jgi:predicted transcriptional regulator
MPASGIAEKLGISGQGLGPVLNKMFTDGNITKKEVDGSFVWGPKGRHLNGKAVHAPN